MVELTKTSANELSVPLGGTTSGRLVVLGGAAGMSIRGAALSDTLAVLRYQGRRPALTGSAGEVVVDFRGFSFPAPATWFAGGPELLLNETVPWSLDLRGGVAKVDADLAALAVTELSIAGGATDLDARLPAPTGSASVKIVGGATKVRFQVPVGTPYRLWLIEPAVDIVIGAERLAMTLEPLRRESADFAAAADRYEFAVGGQVVGLTVTSG
jgi:hypothetical protein